MLTTGSKEDIMHFKMRAQLKCQQCQFLRLDLNGKEKCQVDLKARGN